MTEVETFFYLFVPFLKSLNALLLAGCAASAKTSHVSSTWRSSTANATNAPTTTTADAAEATAATYGAVRAATVRLPDASLWRAADATTATTTTSAMDNATLLICASPCASPSVFHCVLPPFVERCEVEQPACMSLSASQWPFL